MNKNILIAVDDRELVADCLRNTVGNRRYGDIIFQRRRLFSHFQAAMPNWASPVIRLCDDGEVGRFREMLEAAGDDTALLVVSGRAAFQDYGRLRQLIEKLPYARESFTDALYKPLIVFIHNAHSLLGQWPAFAEKPLHVWEEAWQGYERLQSVQQVDLANLDNFLNLFAGSTEARHFNRLQVGADYCTKSSKDRRKILAEYSFYGLADERMQPWLVQPFDYQDDGETASYKMLRYRIADASLPWVHGAFTEDGFASFLDCVFLFMSERPRRNCSKQEAGAAARQLFVDKPKNRVEQFLATEGGRKVNAMAAGFPEGRWDARRQLDRYLQLYGKHQGKIELDFMAVGHGDPCFSNILYDINSQLLMLIDPRGAVKEDELWTNPLYDIGKLSQSILGAYDFINGGLFDIVLAADNALGLRLRGLTNHSALQEMFKDRMGGLPYSLEAVRLCEASLFLSMLPLHLDNPNKALAFLIRAKEIMDEVEDV